MNSPQPRRLLGDLTAWWGRWTARRGKGGAIVILGFALAVAGAAVYLLTSESPWDRGIPEKLARKETLSIRDTIVAGLWLGAALNAALGMVVLLSSRWWARPLGEAPKKSRPLPGSPGAGMSARWFWILTLLAVAAAAWIRAPRLTHSFWNDEEQAFRKFTWGEYEPAKEGGDALVFDPAGWDRALFYSVNGNNHVVHTVIAKVCHNLWRAIIRPDQETFREWVIRLEPFISGLLALFVMAMWLKRAGFPLAGVTAAWLLAIHPWVLRYAVEARGYSAMLLFILLAFFCASEALRTRQWRWWLGYGLCQSLYLLCFAGAVYLAVAMNALLAVMLLWRRDTDSLRRWLVACVGGAMLFLQMMTATVLRIWSWIQAPHVEPFPMDAGYFRDFRAHLFVGVPWNGPEPAKHLGTDIAQLSSASAAWSVAFHYLLPLLLLVGIVAAAHKSPATRFLLITLAGAAALILLHNTVSSLAFYGWYALYLTLGVIVALAFVPEWLGTKRPPAAALLSIALISGSLWLNAKPLATIRRHDRHPMRQAVIAARGEAPAIDVRHAATLTAAVGSGANQIRTYDPRVTWIKTAADLEQAIAEATRTRKPLIIYACGPITLAREHPEIGTLLNDESRFEKTDYLPGQEEFWSFQLYQFRPGE
ncbi:MAG: glycosyltransferase family 39 protein [Verrucomicrobiae bacterium]|nr:glycosyltransferase family 39 protein [Verrucomicrobiae bacterium]